MKFHVYKVCPVGHRLPRDLIFETPDSTYCILCGRYYLNDECVDLLAEMRKMK
jgi:hypothetical protein